MHQISIKIDKKSLSTDWDLIFSSIYHDVIDHIVDFNFSFVHIQDDTSIFWTIQWYVCLSVVIKYKEKDCYADSIKNLKIIILSENVARHVDLSKTYLNNRITIYSNRLNKVATLTVMMQTYSNLWQDHDKIMNISESDYLQIFLKKN